jgi:hypothetical protein
MKSSVHKRINLIKMRNSRNISMVEHMNKNLDYNTSMNAEMHNNNKTMVIEDRSSSHNGNNF